MIRLKMHVLIPINNYFFLFGNKASDSSKREACVDHSGLRRATGDTIRRSLANQQRATCYSCATIDLLKLAMSSCLGR
jgi:hypothetical protein